MRLNRGFFPSQEIKEGDSFRKINLRVCVLDHEACSPETPTKLRDTRKIPRRWERQAGTDWNRGFGTWNVERGTWIREQGRGIWHGTWGVEFGSQNVDGGIGERGRWNRGRGTQNREHGR